MKYDFIEFMSSERTGFDKSACIHLRISPQQILQPFSFKPVMNLILSLIIAFLTLNYFASSKLQFTSSGTEGIDLVLVSYNDTSLSSKNYFRDQLFSNQMILGHNIGIWQNLSTEQHDTPLIVYILPNSIEEFVLSLDQIGILLAVDENSVSEVWDPIFFLEWPNVQNMTMMNNNGSSATSIIIEAIKNYLSMHMKKEIRLDSDVFIIYPTIVESMSSIANSDTSQDPESFLLFEIYTTFDKNLEIQQVQEESIFENYLIKSVRRQNFKGAAIKAVGLADPDFVYQCTLKIVNGTVIFVSGLAVDLLHTLQYASNFSYIGVEGEGWIELLPNGTWSGIAKQIRNGQADLGISQSTHISYRFKGLGFLHPTSSGSVNVYFRQPPASSIRDIFVSPFNAQVWTLLVIIYLILVFSTYVVYWISYQFGQVGYFDKEIRQESMFWCFSVFCQKGWYICPSTTPLRIIFLCGLLVGVIYYVAYSASLVSVLSVQLVPIKSISDLSQSDILILGDFWLPNNHDAVKSIEGGKKRFRQLKEEEQFMMVHEAIPKLLSQPMAFITFSEGFLTVFHRLNKTDREYCSSLTSLSIMKAPVSSGMIVQKGSPLKELMNPKILMMSERGINKRFNQHNTLGTSAQCPRKASQLGQGLKMSDIFSIYFLIGGGYLSSLAIGIFEYAFHYYFHFNLKENVFEKT